MTGTSELAEVTEIIQDVHDLVRRQAWATLDNRLLMQRIHGERVAILVTWLRSTYPVREELPYWRIFKTEVSLYFEDLEIPPHILKGL